MRVGLGTRRRATHFSRAGLVFGIRLIVNSGRTQRALRLAQYPLPHGARFRRRLTPPQRRSHFRDTVPNPRHGLARPTCSVERGREAPERIANCTERLHWTRARGVEPELGLGSDWRRTSPSGHASWALSKVETVPTSATSLLGEFDATIDHGRLAGDCGRGGAAIRCAPAENFELSITGI